MLIRVTAILLFFIKRVKGVSKDLYPFSSASALQEARERLIANVQSHHFSQEIADLHGRNRVSSSSCLVSLSPFLDNNGLLRLGGRLKHADLDFNERCPIIMPFDSPLTSLIVLNGHHFMLHGGTQLTLSYLRRTYWILKGRMAVKKVLSRCVICARFRAKTCSQLMSPLPAQRVTQPSRPFAVSGVDYAGPVWIRTSKGRGIRASKGYLVIFVCFATKSVHLEVCSDYTSEGFIAAYKRFSSRRGVCSLLHSDCGTNFVGADRELRELFRESSSVSFEISRYLASNGTTWRFNPPAAPHFGGLWEAAVRSVKHHLRRVIGEMTLTFEELSTFLCEVEACLNSRPLQALSDEPNDLTPLTPSHFLIGSTIYTIPEPSYFEHKLNSLNRWRLLSKMKSDFWSRWSSEYLHALQTRPKWHFVRSPVKINDLVVIKNENLPPSKWALGRVTKVHAGRDGLVRTATLKTASGMLTRPVVKLCILPICDNL
ncbi:uncharacterized protein LOC122511132 [Leptopilina heterotoma]|uniref:uncharacterized protein LOC122511132 n=1 Tax=Leptopilina heterotoma TaxID=63436 RepID=UPI001CA951DF|nr:uncharacterized protein LOC122511132 [Leptopilina heterotoma]